MNLREFYGLSFNPFTEDVPHEALLPTRAVTDFCQKVEHILCKIGGFGMMVGGTGLGKSTALRLLERHIRGVRDVLAVPLQRPGSTIADFYREVGDHFGVPLRPHNRWAGFRDLRARFVAHIEGTTTRPLLLVDEAQEMSTVVLGELRLLSSTRFDSRSILGVVLAGDERLPEMLRSDALVPLGSRIRTRLVLQPCSPAELAACIEHRLRAAGNATLMTSGLIATLCEHALGNPRVLLGIANELLHNAALQERAQLDEKLFLELRNQTSEAPRRAAAGRKR